MSQTCELAIREHDQWILKKLAHPTSMLSMLKLVLVRLLKSHYGCCWWNRTRCLSCMGWLSDSNFTGGWVLVELTPFRSLMELKDDIVPAAWDYVEWKGSVYGLPYNIDPRFLVYSMEAFQDSGFSGT